jgi:hypothetical protein
MSLNSRPDNHHKREIHWTFVTTLSFGTLYLYFIQFGLLKTTD